MQEQGYISHLAPWRVLALYLVVGGVWFGSVDALWPRLIEDQVWLQRVQRISVYGFVLLAGCLAAWQVQRMLRAERQRSLVVGELAAILQHAPAGMARIAADSGQTIWANERLCSMLGITQLELQQRRLRDWVRPHDLDWARQQQERLLRGEIAYYQDQRHFVHPVGGHACTVVCTITAIEPSPDMPPMLVCVLQDITDIEAARAALSLSEKQLRLALEGSGSGVWEWDLERQSASFSAGVAGMLRYRGQDFQRDFRFQWRLHREDRRALVDAARLALQTGQLFEVTVRLRCFDGVYRWLEARGVRHLDSQGQVVRFSGIISDKTQQRQEADRLRLAATVVDNTMEGIVVADAQSRILSVNKAFTRLLGYEEHELKGQTPKVFKSGCHDKQFYEQMWSSIRSTGHWRGEIWNRRKNGEIFPERMSLSAVKDGSGKVSHYVCMFTDISVEKARAQQLEHLAHRDALTGLSNRVWFMQELERVIHDARDNGEILAVILLNLDRFKDVNDSYGHSVGDQVLKHIAAQVQGALRPGDMIGRMAGDELVVVARRLGCRQEASAIAERLIHAAAQPWSSPDGFAVVVSVSAGICMFPGHADAPPALLQGAHAAVYGAKQGRGSSNAWCFFHEDMTLAARERIALEARLRTAVAAGHMRLFYQPQIEIATGRLVGAEALVRWFDPEEGMISPARFIPVAENSGLIGPLGEWVINEACRQGQVWREQGLPDISLAVNVSLHQFLLTDLVASTADALQQSGYPATLLEMEITESALADRPDEALTVLRGLKELGLRLAIDDFGTGYSSLAHLKRFPIDVLKIDQGFIRDIPHSADDMAISKAVIAMGRSMGMQVLAEGVETADQLDFLRQHGCDFYQGYFCSKPLPAEDFAGLLRHSATLTIP